MVKKIKVIQIAPSSHSWVMLNVERDILADWNARLSFNLRQASVKYEYECWCPEKTYKYEKSFVKHRVKFRIFPSTLCIRFGKEISIPMLKALQREVKQNKVILHIHDYHSWHAYLIALLCQKAVIIGQHHGGRAPLKHIKKHLKLIALLPFLLFEQILEWTALRNFDLLYYLSEEEGVYLRKINESIRYQTMGISNHFKKISKIKKERALLYIGRLAKNKGLYELLSAFKQVQKKHELKLYIIGEGTEKVNLLKKIQKEKIENVEVIDYIDNKELPKYYNKASVFVLPSYTEGAPVTIMEALACKCPVIATNVGGTARLVKENGLLIKPKSVSSLVDALNKFFENPKKYAIKKEVGSQFYWEKIVENTLADYEKLVKKFCCIT